ncbi:MAG: hypothetical protein Q7J22_00530 [Candidatus Wolfebacteria bacterium]|nr:hypothetical protein [Candidatus Wolfebacteria bacterium]MDP2704677.1 hypothetical protein [bacterium]
MKTVAYYSGKIEAREGGEGFLFDQPFMRPGVHEPGTSNLDVLPQNASLDVRSDVIFFSVFFAVVFCLCFAGIFKIRFFGKTLGEYTLPIWYFIAGSILVVFSQYIWVVPSDNIALWGRVTQLLWEVMVGASAYMMIKRKNFGYGNLFFLGVLYSLIIHGSKVSIRYFFYGQTLWYVADRFLYGSLLVMAIVFLGGSIFLFFRRRGMIKF